MICTPTGRMGSQAGSMTEGVRPGYRLCEGGFMSAHLNVRGRLLACCIACVAVLGALVLAPAAGAFSVGSTYLALGDSLAYGYHPAQFEEELAKTGTVNPANFNKGY